MPWVCDFFPLPIIHITVKNTLPHTYTSPCYRERVPYKLYVAYKNMSRTPHAVKKTMGFEWSNIFDEFSNYGIIHPSFVTHKSSIFILQASLF